MASNKIYGSDPRRYRPRWWQFPVNKIYIPPIPKSPERPQLKESRDDSTSAEGEIHNSIVSNGVEDYTADSCGVKKPLLKLREELQEHKVYKSTPRKFSAKKPLPVEFMELDNDGYIYLKVCAEMVCKCHTPLTPNCTFLDLLRRIICLRVNTILRLIFFLVY